MLSSLLRYFPSFKRWEPLNFSNPNFIRIPASQKIEEETIPDYVAARYYPTRIGETVKGRYQVVGKLGFGSSSTVWLAGYGMNRHLWQLFIVHGDNQSD